MNSNVSRPMPRANTGSRFLNWVSNTTMFLLQMERRIDPWLRPIFDATLRDPVARDRYRIDEQKAQGRRLENRRGKAAA